MKILHPASPYFNEELEIEKLYTANGQKKVILRTSTGEKISVSLSWTNFYDYHEHKKNNNLLFNLKGLLKLYELVENIISGTHQDLGEKSYGKNQEDSNSERTSDIVRCSDRKELDEYDNRTEGGDRRNIGRDSNRTSKGSRGLL